jgi:hypothetical protein
MMQRIHGSVTLPATLRDAQVTALDANGKPDRAMPTEHGRFQLGETTLWYLVERPAGEPRHE